MPTQEDRLATLERKVAARELQRLYDERKASENTPSEQAYNYTEINQHLTILLGIASGQEGDIKMMKNDLGIVKVDLDIVKKRVEHQGEDIGVIKDDLGIIKGKFEQVLQQLAALTAKLE